jgi:hypothetical protein
MSAEEAVGHKAAPCRQAAHASMQQVRHSRGQEYTGVLKKLLATKPRPAARARHITQARAVGHKAHRHTHTGTQGRHKLLATKPRPAGGQRT